MAQQKGRRIAHFAAGGYAGAALMPAGNYTATAQGLPAATPAGGYTPGPATNAAGSWGAAAESGGIAGDTNVSPVGAPDTSAFNQPGNYVAPAAALPADVGNVAATPAPTYSNGSTDMQASTSAGGGGGGGYGGLIGGGGNPATAPTPSAIPTASAPLPTIPGNGGTYSTGNSPNWMKDGGTVQNMKRGGKVRQMKPNGKPGSSQAPSGPHAPQPPNAGRPPTGVQQPDPSSAQAPPSTPQPDPSDSGAVPAPTATGTALGEPTLGFDDGGDVPDTADAPVDADQGQEGQAGDPSQQQSSPPPSVQKALTAARAQFGLNDSIFNNMQMSDNQNDPRPIPPSPNGPVKPFNPRDFLPGGSKASDSGGGTQTAAATPIQPAPNGPPTKPWNPRDFVPGGSKASDSGIPQETEAG